MDKIKVELDTMQLGVINEMLLLINIPCIETREIKVHKSILNVISKKLLKKAINKHSRFKKFHISFEVYEADTLEKTMNNYKSFPLGVYEFNVVSIISQTLNQALS